MQYEENKTRGNCSPDIPIIVMAGLVPAIHVLVSEKQVVDARVKPGHDDRGAEPIHLKKGPGRNRGPMDEDEKR